MSTSSLVFRVTSDVATATAGFRKLAASLKPVKKEADQTSTSLAKIGKTQVTPKVNTQAIHKVTTEIARLQDEMRKALELDVHADTREVQRKIRGLTTTLRQLKAPKVQPEVDTRGIVAAFNRARAARDRFYAGLKQRTGLTALAGIKDSLSDVTGGLQKLGGGLANVFKSVGIPLIGAIGVAVAGLGTAIGATAIKALSLADSFARSRIQMNSFVRNMKVTDKLLGSIQKFADTTPFEFPELVSAGRRLLGVGVSAKKVVPQLKKIGDIAAQSGAQVDDLSLIFAQMTSTGRINAEDMNQLADRGVNAWGTLAKATGKSVAELRKLSSEGKLGIDTVNLLWDTLAKGAEGSTTALSKTLSGQISTLKDTATGILRDIGSSILPIVNAVMPLFQRGLSFVGVQVIKQLPGLINTLASSLTQLVTLPGAILNALASVAIGVTNFIAGIQRATGDEAGAIKTLQAGSKVYTDLKDKASAYNDAVKDIPGNIEAARQAAQRGVEVQLKIADVDKELSGVDKKIKDAKAGIKLGVDKKFWTQKLAEANAEKDRLLKKKNNILLDADASAAKGKIDKLNTQLDELKAKKPTPEVRLKTSQLEAKKKKALHDLAVINVQKANPKLDANSAAFKSKVAAAEKKLKETDAKRAHPKVVASSNAATVAAQTERALANINDENVYINVKTRYVGRGGSSSKQAHSGDPESGLQGTSLAPRVQINVNDAKLASLIDVRVNGRAARASKIVRRKAAVVL